jgi:hypothetical protein
MVVGLRDPFDRTVVSRPDLLALTGSSDLDDLSAMVDGESEADMWVAAVEGGIEVGAGGSATVLGYPFALEEFWHVVDEVERAQVDRWEDADDSPRSSE